MQNASKIVYFENKNGIFFLRRGHSSLPDPSSSVEGDTPSPHPTPSRRLRHLDCRAYGAPSSARRLALTLVTSIPV